MIDYLKNKLRSNFLIENKIRQIEKYHTLSADELTFIAEKRALEQLSNVFKESRFYNWLYSTNGILPGDIKSLSDWHKLPVINKKLVKEHAKDIHLGLPLFHHTTSTSGTTGAPLLVYRTLSSIITEQAYQMHFRLSKGLSRSAPSIWIRGELGASELLRYDRSAKILHISSFNINQQNITTIYNRIKEIRPQSIFAYPSSLQILALELSRSSLELHIPLVFTSSETLFLNQRTFIEKSFQCSVHDWYGNAERTIALKQNSDGIYTPPPLYAIVEYLPTGVFTTSLINDCFPLIRYQVDDQFELVSQDNCDLVGSSLRIKSIEGRTDDMVTLLDGSRIGRIGLTIRGITEIAMSQVVQHQPGIIDFYVVKDNNVNEQDLHEKLISRFEVISGDNLKINIHFVEREKLIFSKSGKFKFVNNFIPS